MMMQPHQSTAKTISQSNFISGYGQRVRVDGASGPKLTGQPNFTLLDHDVRLNVREELFGNHAADPPLMVRPMAFAARAGMDISPVAGDQGFDNRPEGIADLDHEQMANRPATRSARRAPRNKHRALTVKQARVVSEDPTIHDSPDATAGAEALRIHYRRVQEWIATHAYDVFAYVCGWCLAPDQVLPRKDDPRGQRRYCSVRCQEASAACHTHQAAPASVTAELMERGEPKRRVARRRKAAAEA